MKHMNVHKILKFIEVYVCQNDQNGERFDKDIAKIKRCKV